MTVTCNHWLGLLLSLQGTQLGVLCNEGLHLLAFLHLEE
jgi:hypothetical protein